MILGRDLDNVDFENLGKGMKVHLNPLQFLLTLEGNAEETFKNLAPQRVAYKNTLHFAIPGIRPLNFTTVVKCFSKVSCASISQVEDHMVVFQSSGPQILLNDTVHFPTLKRPLRYSRVSIYYLFSTHLLHFSTSGSQKG